MIKRLTIKRKGVSLIEVVLVVAIFAIVTPAIYSIFFVGANSFATSKDIGFSQQDARLPIDFINMEIRNAKTVFLSEPSVDDYEEIYYEMALDENNRLTVNTYKKGEAVNPITSKIIGSQIESIEFLPIITIDEYNQQILENNNIDVKVRAIEGNSTKEYTTKIRFENESNFGVINDPNPTNDSTFIIPNVFNNIFYTKYE